VRLFVALTPPQGVLQALRAATAPLQELAPALRWTRPEQWHVTLVFLGEVDEGTTAELARRLERAAARHPPLSLALGGGGRFGQRVLWTGIHGDREGLRRLADSVQAAARRSRLPVQQRPYQPHLTLVRASDPETDLRPLVERLGRWQCPPWVATQLELVRSRLGAGPDRSAVHEPIGSWPLLGQPSVGSTRDNGPAGCAE
jgi:2'-5' RNA ligase